MGNHSEDRGAKGPHDSTAESQLDSDGFDQVDDFDDLDDDDEFDDERFDLGEIGKWLHTWEDLRTESPEVARETRQLPALDLDKPLSAATQEDLGIPGLGLGAVDASESKTLDKVPKAKSTSGAKRSAAKEKSSPPKVLAARPKSARALTPKPAVRRAFDAPSPPAVASKPRRVSAPGVTPEANQYEPVKFGATQSSQPVSPAPVTSPKSPGTSISFLGIDLTIKVDRKSVVFAGGLLVCGLLAALGYVLTGVGSNDGSQTDTVASPVADDVDSLQTVGALPAQTTTELAESTVQIIGLDDDLAPVCAGSGIIVEPNGTILTNAHVVTVEDGCQFTSVGVAVTADIGNPPELLYRAEILATNDILDLAVLRIVDPLDSSSDVEVPSVFPVAALGDSDKVELGDNIRILGYPVIGGETITSTSGTVSGFTSQAGIGSRALIKTDAAISAGNSGGMAIDDEGRVVGVPTRARASESGPAVDCRALSDTNDDGQVDADDNCVPVGGFLNGIRPINLARRLLGEAALVASIEDDTIDEAPAVDIDWDMVKVGNPRFSSASVDDQPVDDLVTAVVGIEELCVFVDWSGIPDGATWDSIWLLNGEVIDKAAYYDQVWSFGESGLNFWLCAGADEGPGRYEVGFFLEGELVFAEGIVVTEEPAEIYEVTWANQTDKDLCGLAVNPFSEGRQVGISELASGESIDAGEEYSMQLPEGVFVVEAFDCDDKPIADAAEEGIEVPGADFTEGEPVLFVISG